MTDFDLPAYLAGRREVVDRALEKALPSVDNPTRNLVEAMRYSLFAGGEALASDPLPGRGGSGW